MIWVPIVLSLSGEVYLGTLGSAYITEASCDAAAAHAHRTIQRDFKIVCAKLILEGPTFSGALPEKK